MIRALQIPTGLGAGNIGDELMARSFWDRLPEGIALEVPLFPESARQREPYPAAHRLRAVDWEGDEGAPFSDLPGLLVGGTPVAEFEGLHFPLSFLARRLLRFHRLGLPVDAVGVGVDRLENGRAVEIFREAFGPVRSWSVRSESCREALLSLGVDHGVVTVGADWAWLHRPRADRRVEATKAWRRAGVDPARPFVAVNTVNLNWRGLEAPRRALAAALDAARDRLGLQVGFFCNECRAGEFYDLEAAREVRALMEGPAALLPNEYWSVDEALALLSHATVVVGARYHVVVESALAGVPPVGLLRGQKMRSLARDLRFEVGGTVEAIDRDELFSAIERCVAERDDRRTVLAEDRARLAIRAGRNLDLVRRLPPYASAFQAADG